MDVLNSKKGLLPWTRSNRTAWFALGLLAAIGVGVVYFVDPRVAGNYPPCPFLYLTGCYCPGCGTLRAVHRLLHGDLPGAIGYNPLTIAFMPFLAGCAADCVAWRWGRPSLAGSVIPPQAAWKVLIAVISLLGVAQRASLSFHGAGAVAHAGRSVARFPGVC